MATAEKTKPSRNTLRKKGRDARKKKLQADPEARKAFHEGKSKRANDKKAAFRKKKRGK
jgi:hypothetical protein